MTPTEQDKELREQVSTAMYDTDYKHVIEEPDYYDKAAVDAVVEFITADRKRVAVEARLDELNNVRDMDLSLVAHHRVIDRIAELKAQQEGVEYGSNR